MDTKTHVERRQALRRAVPEGAILFLGLEEAPRNYPANPYPFRQDSHFLYYVGTNLPGMAALITPDGGEILFGAPEDPDDLVWHGPHPGLADHAERAGIAGSASTADLPRALDDLRKQGVKIHYLPPYRAERCIHLGGLLDVHPAEVAAGASQELARAVVEQLSIKTAAEVLEIEEALQVSSEMYQAAFRVTEAGRRESEVAGAMQGVALMYDRAQSFPPIVSVRGEVLHNTSYRNILEDGQLLLIDSGTESPGFYASDITRTIPVSGHYSDEQRLIY
ncbi:MAG: aminopeptidase P family protein, partial [Deltaproteobacteria bacterium]|nr:aminopeptidase P family protein [Deltaproteobacteria bacterium]